MPPLSAFAEAEASYKKVLSSSPPPALALQASRNLASLYHSWARAAPSPEKRALLEKAIALYLTLPECALELAGAYAESGQADKAQLVYEAKLGKVAASSTDPKLLMAQTNYALLKKDVPLAASVCSAWGSVPGDTPELRAARLKALSAHAFLLLDSGADGAVGAYSELKRFAAQKGLTLDAEAEHNAGVAAHGAALKAAGAGGKIVGAEAV